MNGLTRQQGVLHMDGVSLAQVAADYGTPAYVYSRDMIEQAWRSYDQALQGIPHCVCYAVKANSNLAVLNLLARLGSGFDVVSVGELQRALHAGGSAEKVVFSGVGKTEQELRVSLEAGVGCFNVESMGELERLARCARDMGKKAPVAVRVNPDIDPETHPYIATGLQENKFGIPHASVMDAYQAAAGMEGIEITGIACHIGSQITQLDPFRKAVAYLRAQAEALREQGIHVRHIDVGGGLAVPYQDEAAPSVEEYVAAIREGMAGMDCELRLEPGRSIVARAGVLLTQVQYLKHGEEHHFAVVDAGMNDLLRPALYQGWHEVSRVCHDDGTDDGGGEERTYDIVGPVCETGDFLAKGRRMALREDDLLAVADAGAYGFVMSSQYNTRPRACELIIDRGAAHEVRKREEIPDLWQGESLLDLS